MKAIVLGSGSKGNCTYLETPTRKLLIDCGFSFRQIRLRLEEHGIDPSGIEGVLITHEHTDHVSGLASFFAKHKVPLYISPKAYGKLHPNQKSGIAVEQLKFIEEDFSLGNLDIELIHTSHDAADPLGYIFKEDNMKTVLVTDTGYLPESILEPLKGAHLYLFESNYDPEMLFDSSRPFFLKQRIMGNSGHLSNEASALLLNKLVTDDTKHICFIHLSEETNTPGTARRTHIELLEQYEKLQITYSSQYQPTNIINLDGK